MKKFLSLLLIIPLLMFCGCFQSKEETVKTKNMLQFENEDKSYLGIKSRYESVAGVIKTEVTGLESSYNETLKQDNPDNYFLDDSYILSSFSPFNLSYFYLTDYFDDHLTEDSAKVYYENEADGRDIIYTSDSSAYTLKFSSENSTSVCSVEYNKSKDSFRYSYVNETPEGEETVEFLDFVKTSENSYSIMTLTEKCCVDFDSEGNIEYFCISTLDNQKYQLSSGIYGSSSVSISSKSWVCKGDDDLYSSIVEFDNGVLTHKDTSSGTEKSVSINESDYESAFI